MCGPLSATSKRRSSPGGGLAAWSSAAPLFVGADGERITRGTLQNRVQRAFRRAGIDADRPRRPRPRLRHTFATEPTNADVSVYTLMELLGPAPRPALPPPKTSSTGY